MGMDVGGEVESMRLRRSFRIILGEVEAGEEKWMVQVAIVVEAPQTISNNPPIIPYIHSPPLLPSPSLPGGLLNRI